MSRGGRRPGAGRKPKALAALRLEGGFRPGRHASLLKAAPSRMAEATKSDQGTNSSLDSFRAPRLDASVLPVPAGVVEGLGPAGFAFVAATWAETEGWSTTELALLRLAGVTLDDIAATETVADRGKAIRCFAALVGQLGLDRLREGA